MLFRGTQVILIFLVTSLAIPVESRSSDSLSLQASQAKKARTKSKRQNIKVLQSKAENDFRRHDILMRRQQYLQMQQSQQQGMQKMLNYQRETANPTINQNR